MTAAQTSRTYALLLGSAAGLEAELSADIALLQAVDSMAEIHVRVPADGLEAIRELVGANAWDKVASVEAAQASKDATVLAVLTALRPVAADDDLVLIGEVEHRSLTAPVITFCLAAAAAHGTAILGSRVEGDVLHPGGTGRVVGIPRIGWTYVAAGLLTTQFSRFYEPYDWAARIATESIEAPYRWSLGQAKAVMVAADGDGGAEYAIPEQTWKET